MERTARSPSRQSRFAQANKEALITLGLYLAYFVWWYSFAYGLGGGDPAEYSYIWGFPAWFFYSCIAGYPLLTLALWFVVRFFFQDLPLDAYVDTTVDTAKDSTLAEEPDSDTPQTL